MFFSRSEKKRIQAVTQQKMISSGTRKQLWCKIKLKISYTTDYRPSSFVFNIAKVMEKQQIINTPYVIEGMISDSLSRLWVSTTLFKLQPAGFILFLFIYILNPSLNSRNRVDL